MISLYQYLPDDRTEEETKILNAVMVRIYNELPDPKDKFILAFCFHLGYGKEDTARALGMSHVAVWKRMRKIRLLLQPMKQEVLGDPRAEVKVTEEEIVG